MELKITTSILA